MLLWNHNAPTWCAPIKQRNATHVHAPPTPLTDVNPRIEDCQSNNEQNNADWDECANNANSPSRLAFPQAQVW